MQIRNQYIFILGTAKFDGPYESTSYTIAKHLAKENYVYYLDSPFTWRDYFRLRATEELKRRRPHFSLKASGIIDTGIDKLKVVISPLMLSINFLPEGKLYRQLVRINDWLIAKRIKGILKQQQVKDFIYINSFNFHYPNVGELIHPSLTIYQCVDPMIIPYDMKHGIVSEEQLVRKSNLVICTSKQLYEEKKQLNEKTYFVPNAADITHSSKALSQDLAVHESIRELKKPIIGYFGNIERRFDFDLLKEVVEAHRDKSFVFAGPVSPEFIPDWFYNTPNVHLVGRLPYQAMPALFKGFDVALIPFKKDDVSRTIFPLKLFEYLGAGKPVVSTRFNPDLEDFTHGTVAFCDDAASFSQAIDQALLHNGTQQVEERIAVAQENTWEKRVQEISRLITQNKRGYTPSLADLSKDSRETSYANS